MPPEAADATITRASISRSSFVVVSPVAAREGSAGSGAAAGGGDSGGDVGDGVSTDEIVGAGVRARSARRAVPLAAFRAAWTSSPHEPNRSAGSLASAVAITPSNACGKAGRARLTDGGGSTRCACSTACSVLCANGGDEVKHSYSTQPSAYTSVRASTG